MMTALLVALILTLMAGLAFSGFLRARTLDRLAEYRIALDFIAEDHADLPHEFAAIFIAGNRPAMERKFPGFAEFRAACIRERESVEAKA
ncbi:MAG: hypothetical protein JWR80_7971 [Bradyrhizobium sp.]|nr:hypothetical protein [Bradyrhizobium sp.]